MLDIALSGFARAMWADAGSAIRCIYSGEQPGSATGFAVKWWLVRRKNEDFRIVGGAPGCSFAAFNSGISHCISLLHTSGNVSLSVLRV
jgi:hypothetical protein